MLQQSCAGKLYFNERCLFLSYWFNTPIWLRFRVEWWVKQDKFLITPIISKSKIVCESKRVKQFNLKELSSPFCTYRIGIKIRLNVSLNNAHRRREREREQKSAHERACLMPNAKVISISSDMFHLNSAFSISFSPLYWQRRCKLVLFFSFCFLLLSKPLCAIELNGYIYILFSFCCRLIKQNRRTVCEARKAFTK